MIFLQPLKYTGRDSGIFEAILVGFALDWQLSEVQKTRSEFFGTPICCAGKTGFPPIPDNFERRRM